MPDIAKAPSIMSLKGKGGTTWSIIQELDEQALFRRLEPVQRRAYLRQLQPLVDEALLSLTDTKQQFGLMNYGFSLPISLEKRMELYDELQLQHSG